MAEHSQHIACRDVVDLVNDYLEGALSPEDTSLFEQHLNFCDGCITYVNQIRITMAAVGRVREEDVAPEVRERLLDAFRHWRQG